MADLSPETLAALDELLRRWTLQMQEYVEGRLAEEPGAEAALPTGVDVHSDLGLVVDKAEGLQFVGMRVERDHRTGLARIVNVPETWIAAQQDGVLKSDLWRTVNFHGAGVQITDDPGHERIDIDIPGSPLAHGVAMASDNSTKVLAVPAGTNPDTTYAGWKTYAFDDSAWTLAASVIPNSADYSLVPLGATPIWSKASGAPYQVSGAQIGADVSVPVTSTTGVSTGWTLTIGNIYAIETIGGPWNASGPGQPHFDLVTFSAVQTGTPAGWSRIDSASVLSWETTTDAQHFRVYFTATATGLFVGVSDSIYGDNTGTISVRLFPAQAIEVLVRQKATLTAITGGTLSTAFDSNGSVFLNATAEGVDSTTGAAGPLIESDVTGVAITGNNVIAAHAKGVGGSAPDKGWVAFALATLTGNALEPYVNIQDRKASGSAGGTFTSGAWRKRDLNLIVRDTSGIATLSASQITLPPGTYRWRSSCPAFSVRRNQSRLQNITAGTTLIVGTNEYSIVTAGLSSASRSLMADEFALAVTSVLEVQHQCEVTAATNGFGVEMGSVFAITHELYTVVEIWKLT